jgi:hypothetical protein
MATPTLEELDVEGVTVGTPRGEDRVEADVTYKGAPLKFALPCATVRCKSSLPYGERVVSFEAGGIAAAMSNLEDAVKPSNPTWLSHVDNDSVRAKLSPRRSDVRLSDGTRLRELPPTPWCSHRVSAILEARRVVQRPPSHAFLELRVQQLQLGAE